MTGRSPSRQLALDTEAALRASRALVGIAARSLSVVEDVTVRQFRALVILARGGPTSSGELAGHLNVHQSTLTRLVDRLVRKGLVERLPIEGDRRGVCVGLTEKGVEMVRAVTDARRHELAEVLRELPESRRSVVIAAFEEFSHAAGEPPDDEWFTAIDLAGPHGRATVP
jgi:DNA-binding MarR family transcriptional regulator